MKTLRFLSITVGLLFILSLSSCTPFLFQAPLFQSLASQSSLSQSSSSQPLAPQYYSPLENAKYVSKASTIVVRYGPVLTNQNLNGLKFTVKGSESGFHAGQTILADDHKTVIFKPVSPFLPGEQVAVNVNSLQLDWQTSYPALSYIFTVANNQQPGSPGSSELSAPPIPSTPPRSAFPNFLTVPQDIPHYHRNDDFANRRRRRYLCLAFLLDQSRGWILSADSE